MTSDTSRAGRDAIFGDLRKSLGRTQPGDAADIARPDALGVVAADHERPGVPVDSIEGFVVKLIAAGATVDRVRVIDDVPDAVNQFVEEHQIERRAMASKDDVVNSIQWPGDWTIAHGPATSDAGLSVTGALGAVAETGSLVLRSDEDSPTSLNFLPDNHVVVVKTDQISTHLEDVWAALRSSGAAMPRAVNFITGPSKTADVEQVLQHGAHGPRRLHVVLVG